MPNAMYDASVPVMLQFLTASSRSLDKASSFAKENGIGETELLATQLYPNMRPLSYQYRAMTHHACHGCAWLTGSTPLAGDFDETAIASVQDRLAKTIAYVAGFDASQFDGSQERVVSFSTPRAELRFTGKQFLLNFTMPNLFFHATTAHNILRSIGVDVGKLDFMGAMPQLPSES